jgi:peptidoglycan hydrolase-like protein with peptidoglycan-binding domain
MKLHSILLGAALAVAVSAQAMAAPPAAQSGSAAASAKATSTKSARHSATWRAQDKLKTLGMYSGPVDGKRTGVYVAALKSYQTAHKIKASGHLDRPTMRSLGI